MNFKNLLLAAVLAVVVSETSTLAQTPLVNHGDIWRYRLGTNAAQANWQTASDASLDASWLSGPGGIGYGDGDDATNIQSGMSNKCTTVYLRRVFSVGSPVDEAARLSLTMDYDDGFVAYLDGVEIARGNTTNGVGSPVVFNATTGSHEASAGSGGNPPTTFDLGAVGSRLAVGNHVLAIHGINQNLTSSDLSLIADLFLGTAGCPANTVCSDTNWSLAISPVTITSSLTIAAGATLTIDPGVTVQLAPGASLIVADGGRLIAEGTSNAPIRFTRSGTSGTWGHIVIDGSVGSPESRIAYAHIELNGTSPTIDVAGGTAVMDHLTFGNTGIAYIHVDGASFVISHCHFPTATASFELVHGTAGIKSGGRGIFFRNFFGAAIGYNDVVDFTGGNRPGPIVQFIENVFTGSDDDLLDLDSTDAWVEGNIFLHTHRNGGAPDSSSAVSGGADNADTSEITIIGNIIFDCDQAATAKQGNFYTLFNNTIVHQTRVGGIDTNSGVVNVRDFPQGGTPTAFGAGFYLEGNIILDAEALVRNFVAGQTSVILSNNIMPYSWPYGGGNYEADPLFVHVPTMAETVFTNWAQAQIMREWLTLQPGSPGIGTGPGGSDMGGVIPLGVFVSGEPEGTTSDSGATIHVGLNRSGSGIPVAGFPAGSGYTSYKWRLDTNAWSVEMPINTPIQLIGLTDGPHHVEVSGKRDSAYFQDDAVYGDVAVVTLSRTWTVQSSTAPRIESIQRVGNVVTLTFNALAGRSYSVFYRDELDALHPWVKLQDVPAAGAGIREIVDNGVGTGARRFYQLVSPVQP